MKQLIVVAVLIATAVPSSAASVCRERAVEHAQTSESVRARLRGVMLNDLRRAIVKTDCRITLEPREGGYDSIRCDREIHEGLDLYRTGFETWWIPSACRPGERVGYVVYANGLPDDRDFHDVVVSGRFVSGEAVEKTWAEAVLIYRAERTIQLMEEINSWPSMRNEP